ncbi:hypothetical protein PFISCL1PPCAC_25849, partial [Pristionchus fissidentatus]
LSPHLSAGRRGGRRVQEDAAVEQRSVHVRHHRADVALAVHLRRGLGVLARADVLGDALAPGLRVSLVDGVDGAARLALHVGM